MKILVTGARGFIGKNLVAELKSRKVADILEFDVDTPPEKLEEYAKECGFVYHLAGVNRPKDEKEFMEGNFGLTAQLLDLLEKNGNKAPILITSSVQAEKDNPYGKSKKAGEDLLFDYSRKTGVMVYVYRLPNMFGKWSRPNYNTVVATFCHNIARGQDIVVNDPEALLTLCYIDDLLEEFVKVLSGVPAYENGFCVVPVTYQVKLGQLAELIRGFARSRTSLDVPDMSDGLTRKLYATYLSFLPENNFLYDLKMNVDARGSFTEFIRTAERGQVSVNISRPGITKGNHWHHTKNEKFLVVSGEGVIRFRRPDDAQVIEYKVSGSRLQVVDIPPGYTHNISNTGTCDMVTIMWVNECFNPEKPDTNFLEV
jgi:UDP-2-acetamido-2,6-beta-L-arabino-hexul-4-ose reductase